MPKAEKFTLVASDFFKKRYMKMSDYIRQALVQKILEE